MSTKADVGTPPSGFHRWESAELCFHGFADLPTTLDNDMDSPVFLCLGHQWCLAVCPGGDAYSAAGEVTVCLNSMSNESIEVDYLFTVKNSAGKEVACSEPELDNFFSCLYLG